MKKLTGNEIRKTWLNFFKEKGHVIEPGASLVPENDPTLLWINSGVAALKKYFDGSVIPPARRITNVQKSIRTNDIENVGKTARHHTFFEMLGNFSIGDYFRNEVIPWAFEILTSEKYFGLDKNKLYVTYNPRDIDTKNLWIKQGLDESHLIPLEANFWEIGEGPCGPNTEVFYDRGNKYDPENVGVDLLKNDIENDRYIEIWGIVFSQYNAVKGVKREDYKELPSKNIDTGAGLERIACILQETNTNFETDLFWPIIEKVEVLSNHKYHEDEMSFRVIADHIRTCVFALADGAYFSNSLRGYVLRRLLRRAMRYGKKLGINGIFLYQLVDSVVDIMKDFYPYLVDKKEIIKKLIIDEENKFLKTLKSGETLLNSLIEKNHDITGKDAFLLYDTYGFPFELTREMALEHNIEVNESDFNKLMEEQKERARNSRKIIDSMNIQSKDLLDFKEKSEFLYNTYEVKAKVIGLFKDGKKIESIDNDGYVIFDKTPFYAEMGGQVSDSGEIFNDSTKALVNDVISSPNKQNMHFVEIEYGEIHVGDEFTLKINILKRQQIQANHSATHLLHKALKLVLGEQVSQKGSYVCENYLRFDFNYLNKISKNQLNEIESKVNDFIKMDLIQKTQVLPIKEALKINAEHEFDTKYGDYVRIVSFGDVSSEFCGGTHVSSTKDIGIFTIKSEESIAAGIRRIEAITSYSCYDFIKELQGNLNELEEKMSCKSFKELSSKLVALILENKNNLKQIEEDNLKLANIYLKLILSSKVDLNGKNICLMSSDFTREIMIKISDNFKLENSILVLIGKKDEKGKYPLLVCDTLNDKNLNSKIVFSKLTQEFGGNGGGRPNLCNGAILQNDINVDKLIKIIKGA